MPEVPEAAFDTEAPGAVTPDEIRAELERIVSSSVFVHSNRLIRFLRFVVERTLESRSEGLKEYVIGVEVFDRDKDFDPRTDPIVRVEARRLRSKIRQYYKGEGRNDAARITFSKGRYEPAFRRRPEHVPRRLFPAKLILKFGNTQADVRPLMDRVMAEGQPAVLPSEGPDHAFTAVSPLFDESGRCVGVQIAVAPDASTILGNGSNAEHQDFALVLKQVTDSNTELLAINEQLQDALERLLEAGRESDRARVQVNAANNEMAKQYKELSRLNEQWGPRLRQLSRMNDFLEQVVNELQVGIMLLDREMRVLTINRAAEKMWGIAPGEARRESFMGLFEHIPVDNLKDPIRHCLRDNVSQEVVLAHDGGRVRCRILPASSHLYPALNSASGILLVMQPA